MAEIKGTEDNFKAEVLESDKPVLVDFWATWCGPCKMLAPTVAAIAQERNDIKVVKVDVDENPNLAVEYGVSSIPTLIVFKNGAPVKQSVGLVPRSRIDEMLA
ncbi:MAG: thioredoxin [Lachnospiraceae bacterium]|jgi:thioredoxin 1